MSQPDYVDVPITLTKELTDKLYGMTKKQLIEKFIAVVMENEVYKERTITACEDAEKLERKMRDLQTKLDKSEAYVEQGRAMIEAVMERWYEYDV